MTAEVVENPSTPVVDVLTVVLQQLWPEASAVQLRRHAETLARLQSRQYGSPDVAATARLSVLLAPPTCVGVTVDPDTEIELPYGHLFLRTWTADMDRRPKSGKLPRWTDPDWAPGGSKRYGPSKDCTGPARHGECTPCGKARVLRQAVYRVSDAADTYSRQSLCEKCARKMLGGPVVVPQFSSPEEAQAWLDAQE